MSNSVSFEWRIVRWIIFYLEYGVEEHPGHTHRMMRATNALTLYVGLVATPYALLYAAYDFEALWPLTAFVFFGGISSLFLPFLNKWSSSAAAIAVVAIWLPGVSFLTFGLSTDAGVHNIYLANVALWLVMFGYENRIRIAILTMLAIGVFLLNEALFKTPAYVSADSVIVDIVWYTWTPSTFIIIFVVVLYALFVIRNTEADLEAEHKRSEALLRNVLPEKIADRLKGAPDDLIADDISDVTILFADITDFTPRATKMPAADLVRFLDRVFTEFDHMTTACGLTKIKTIGDAYMVAAGMPEPREDHAEAAAELAFQMLAACERLSDEFGEEINVRIGLNTGPAVAGVIGKQRFAYDVWGDTVNTAARMESHGEPVKIQVTEATLAALGDKYRYEPRGEVEIKGKGLMETWWLRRHPNPVA